MYVEDVLGAHFGDLVRFVKAAEAAAKQVCPAAAHFLLIHHSTRRRPAVLQSPIQAQHAQQLSCA